MEFLSAHQTKTCGQSSAPFSRSLRRSGQRPLEGILDATRDVLSTLAIARLIFTAALMLEPIANGQQCVSGSPGHSTVGGVYFSTPDVNGTPTLYVGGLTCAEITTDAYIVQNDCAFPNNDPDCERSWKIFGDDLGFQITAYVSCPMSVHITPYVNPDEIRPGNLMVTCTGGGNMNEKYGVLSVQPGPPPPPPIPPGPPPDPGSCAPGEVCTSCSPGWGCVTTTGGGSGTVGGGCYGLGVEDVIRMSYFYSSNPWLAQYNKPYWFDACLRTYQPMGNVRHSVGSVNALFGLGRCSFGMMAGSLQICEEYPTNTLSTPTCLHYNATNSECEVITNSAGAIRQLN